MKILKILLTTLTFHALPLYSAELPTTLPLPKSVSSLGLDSGILLKPYITIYNFTNYPNSREVAIMSPTDAVMHLSSTAHLDRFPIEVKARVDLLGSRNFEQFEIRLAPAPGTQSGRARIWLWRSGQGAAGRKGWIDLPLPRVLNGQASGMAYPLVQHPISFTGDGMEWDILKALDAAQATKDDRILIENLNKQEGTPERFGQVLVLKNKSDIFLREFGKGRKTYTSGAYQSRDPEGNLVIFPKVPRQVSSPNADGATQTNIAFNIGGSRVQFDLRSRFVQGTGGEVPTYPERLWGHTVPQTLTLTQPTAAIPPGATLKIYKDKSLVRSVALKAGASVDLSDIEDLRPRAFTSSNQYELLMVISWGGRDYGFLELIQGEQPTRLPIVQGASLPY